MARRKSLMKVGIRKPSLKRSLKARTTGRAKRSIKKAINPFYGKKGIGFIFHPIKAVYGWIYRRVTVGVGQIVRWVLRRR